MTAGSKGRRPRRVAVLVRDHLGGLIIRDIQPRFASLITVTRVEMTPDLLTARVSLSVMGPDDPRRVLEALEAAKPLLRRSIASSINFKYNPALAFELDPVPGWESKLDQLIQQAAKTDDQEPG